MPLADGLGSIMPLADGLGSIMPLADGDAAPLLVQAAKATPTTRVNTAIRAVFFDERVSTMSSRHNVGGARCPAPVTA